MSARRWPLTISSLTLGQAAFEERVRVAALAEFSAIGLSVEVYDAARRSGLDDTTMQAILDEYGIVVREVEFLSDWPLGMDPIGRVRSKETVAFHIARTFTADHVNVGLFESCPLDLMRRSFAALCSRAEDIKIALEFMPFGGIPDLRTAAEIVHFANRSNAGLVIDIWHWVRAAAEARDLAPVAERVFVVQLCDVASSAMADLRYESRHHRLIPGAGDGHANSVLALLGRQGIEPDVSVEVMSDALLAKGVQATADAVMAGTRSVLANHTWLSGDVAG